LPLANCSDQVRHEQGENKEDYVVPRDISDQDIAAEEKEHNEEGDTKGEPEKPTSFLNEVSHFYNDF